MTFTVKLSFVISIDSDPSSMPQAELTLQLLSMSLSAGKSMDSD